MSLTGATTAVDKVEFLTAMEQEEDVEEEVDEDEETIVATEVVEEVAVHLIMELISHMSPITLNMKGRLYSQNKQEEW